MSRSSNFCVCLCWLMTELLAPRCEAHVSGDPAHDRLALMVASELAAERLVPRTGPLRLAQVRTEKRSSMKADEAPAAAAVFAAFGPAVQLRRDEKFLWVESNGLPAHAMMVGITAWQQQVPLPQPYVGKNAWQIPLHPVVAAKPASIKNRFLRGAIALAANGIPIFNPQNNRGEISQEIGELDQWGGHCGRADDYHYHAAPLHLQSVVGAGKPIAYALDGYAIYGLTEPDGAKPGQLDAFNGHETASLGYHYHSSLKYPYVNGGFHGEVVERDGQVEPQPRAQSVRPALTPLRGAKIVGFTGIPGTTPAKLDYTVNGKAASVSYTALGAGAWKFQFGGTDGSSREETYREGGGGRAGAGGGQAGGKKGKGGGNGKQLPVPERGTAGSGGGDGEFTTQTYEPKRTGAFALRSPAVVHGGVLPTEFTGDGASLSPPLEWSGAPTGTKAYTIIMHHIDPEEKVKWYWTVYNIPAEVSSLPKNATSIGTLGNNSVTRRAGYAPPHSKGPGEKTYILTAYALATPLVIAASPHEVNRDVLLAAMKDTILDSAELKVVYTRPAASMIRSGSERDRGTKKSGGKKT